MPSYLITNAPMGDAVPEALIGTYLWENNGYAPRASARLTLTGDTLHLRMERHVANARAVAEYLLSDSRISWVSFPELPDSPDYALVQKYMPNGTCGVISFGVKGGREAAIRFMDNLKLAAIATHVADLRTCVLHPASTTHRQLNDQQLIECGVTPDLIRFSVGIENVQDIIDDIKQELNQV